MFTVNAINKTISTKSKIGDTWYQYSDYIVENNKPKLIRRHTDDYEHAPFYRETIEELKGNKMLGPPEAVSLLKDIILKNVSSFMLIR